MVKTYKCPFNYIGSKSKILDQILPLIDSYEPNIVVDLFAGGFSVGANCDCKNIICNDVNYHMINLLEYIYINEIDILINDIEKKIKEYELSDDNKNAFIKLRDDFNKSNNSLLFLLLIYYSFNHQIRFNQKGEFNTPFGRKRSKFTLNSKNNLIEFSKKIKNKKIEFSKKDFSEFNILKNNKVLYFCDPPYLITCGSYNDGNRGISSWDESKEKELLNFLDKIDSERCKFVLTNIVVSGDKVNTLLLEWSKKYKVIKLNSNYSNSNYHKQIKNQEEILITNIEEV